jgi:hypothetical protein
MGMLVARQLPTLGGVADHTYVECGTGAKAWGCFGRKAGGHEIRRAPGSTIRADAIAGSDEHAGITCYLLNGVCHQAANRILDPAGINASGARGYGLSTAVYGPFGRPRFPPCFSPFDDKPGVWGDLAECMPSLSVPGSSPDVPLMTSRDWVYLRDVQRIYWRSAGSEPTAPRDFMMQMDLFQQFAVYRLPRLGSEEPLRFHQLLAQRFSFEQKRVAAEGRYSEHGSFAQFAADFDELTISFQDALGELLNAEDFVGLLDVRKDERIVLADPEIVRELSNRRTNDPGATF